MLGEVQSRSRQSATVQRQWAKDGHGHESRGEAMALPTSSRQTGGTAYLTPVNTAQHSCLLWRLQATGGLLNAGRSGEAAACTPWQTILFFHEVSGAGQ